MKSQGVINSRPANILKVSRFLSIWPVFFLFIDYRTKQKKRKLRIPIYFCFRIQTKFSEWWEESMELIRSYDHRGQLSLLLLNRLMSLIEGNKILKVIKKYMMADGRREWDTDGCGKESPWILRLKKVGGMSIDDMGNGSGKGAP